MTREEAIELLEDVIGAVEDNQGRDYDTAFRMAIEALADKPTGEWVRAHVGTIAESYYCSRCGNNGYQTDLCHSCGARMKGGMK